VLAVHDDDAREVDGQGAGEAEGQARAIGSRRRTVTNPRRDSGDPRPTRTRADLGRHHRRLDRVAVAGPVGALSPALLLFGFLGLTAMSGAPNRRFVLLLTSTFVGT